MTADYRQFESSDQIKTNILIVARTQMGAGNVCIGGLDLYNNKNVRMLASGGENQQIDAPFQIGQIWEIEYIPKTNLTPPHLEDVMIKSYRLNSTLSSAGIINIITKKCFVVSGSLDGLFGGSVASPLRRASFIDHPSNAPNHSVCFWRPNSDLTHMFSHNKDRYHYCDEKHDTIFAYVGMMPPIETIPQGSLVRMSLARWWSPPNSTSKVCYLQLSGWYSEHTGLIGI